MPACKAASCLQLLVGHNTCPMQEQHGESCELIMLKLEEAT